MKSTSHKNSNKERPHSKISCIPIACNAIYVTANDFNRKQFANVLVNYVRNGVFAYNLHAFDSIPCTFRAAFV